MNLIKTATSSALIAALSLSVGCASKPDAQNVDAEPVQEAPAMSDAQEAPVQTASVESNEAKAVSAKTDDKPNSAVTTASSSSESNVTKAADVSKQATPSADNKPAVVDVEPKTEKKVEQSVAEVPEAKPAVSEAPQKTAAAEAKPASSNKNLTANALNISEKDLPVTLELWTLRKSFQPGDGLELSTPTLQMGDGDYLSQIRLTLNADQLVINSSSDIDTSLNGVGIRYNGGDLIPIDHVEAGTIGVIKGDWMSRFAEGGTLEIALGFFPDKAQDSPLFKKEASIDALSKLVPTYYKLQ
jgi:hypothetical protein